MQGLKILPGKYAESMVEQYEAQMGKAKVPEATLWSGDA